MVRTNSLLKGKNMDNRTKGILTILGVGVIAYTIGYHNGVRSMVVQWQKDVSPALANYLAAQDTINRLIKPDDEDSSN